MQATCSGSCGDHKVWDTACNALLSRAVTLSAATLSAATMHMLHCQIWCQSRPSVSLTASYNLYTTLCSQSNAINGKQLT